MTWLLYLLAAFGLASGSNDEGEKFVNFISSILMLFIVLAALAIVYSIVTLIIEKAT